MTIDGITALSEAIVLTITLAGVRRMVRLQLERTKYTPRLLRVMRVCRIGTYAVGAVIILFAVYLAVTKARHIQSLRSTLGTITGVQKSHHTIAPYSFYADYTADGRRKHDFLNTWTPFSRNKGDAVKVLYDPTGLSKPEALILDSDWLTYMILFAAGGLAAAFAGWMYGWR